MPNHNKPVHDGFVPKPPSHVNNDNRSQTAPKPSTPKPAVAPPSQKKGS